MGVSMTKAFDHAVISNKMFYYYIKFGSNIGLVYVSDHVKHQIYLKNCISILQMHCLDPEYQENALTGEKVK